MGGAYVTYVANVDKRQWCSPLGKHGHNGKAWDLYSKTLR